MSHEENEISPEMASLERRRAKVRRFKVWLRRVRIVLALAAVLLGAYIFVSYRIYTLPGTYDETSNKIQSPVADVMPGDTLLLQSLNLWREPKLGDTVIYKREELKEGVPDTLIGRVVGLPGETVRRDGPTMRVGGREPLPVGFDIGPDTNIKNGDVIPEGRYMITMDTDAIGYADSRDLGYIPRGNIEKRVTMNLSLVFGDRGSADE